MTATKKAAKTEASEIVTQLTVNTQGSNPDSIVAEGIDRNSWTPYAQFNG